MPEIQNVRHTADLGGAGDDPVVCPIGMQVSPPGTLAASWPVFTTMPRMRRHLQAPPEPGLLGYQQPLLPAPLIVQ